MAYSSACPGYARIRARRLVLCLSAALLSPLSIAMTPAASPTLSVPHAAKSAFTGKYGPDHPDAPLIRPVLNCDDAGADSLRDVIENQALDGDIVDVGLLPMLCGVADSTITLTSGEIVIAKNDLTMRGPPLGTGTVTISGGGKSRTFRHSGAGNVSFEALTIADGYFNAANNAQGGCIASDGDVYLKGTIVTGCTASSDTAYALGGAIYAKNSVALLASTITGNKAIAPLHGGLGGGIWTNNLYPTLSSISGNVAQAGQYNSYGGGAEVTGVLSVLASTIDDNTASYGGGLIAFGNATIVNSTISGNVADKVSALHVQSDALTISNSTIAFNHANIDPTVAAVNFYGFSATSTFKLDSSIIADNTAGANDIASDLSVTQAVLAGADNLVMASNVSAPGFITVTEDPKLGPLQFNGGWNRTHMLIPGSPALGKGNNDTMKQTDQRGGGYPRTTGTGANITTDIGAVEFDSIFFGDFD
jgi:hypothetical protein